MKELLALNSDLAGKSPTEVLKYFLNEYKGCIALASSLGLEDQVLTHMMVKLDPSSRIFTLDTGRLFPETYDLMERTCSRYGIIIEIFSPDAQQVEAMVNTKGINLFYYSVENRKECCRIRKIEPLRRAFAGLKVWICGLRREQSVTRTGMRTVEWDGVNGLIKVNPLIDWTQEELWGFVRNNNVPYNPLHHKGFPSIGCQPCTRAIEPGEDVRAGRWWWENPESKECGLHRRGSS